MVAGFFLCLTALPAEAATFTVNSTEDTTDGACNHPYTNATNDCTLREAIIDANATPGADTIEFNITTANFADDGDDQFTITMNSALTTITETVDIDATAMWDTVGTTTDRPGIRIQSASTTYDGLTIQANATEVRALDIDGFRYGINLTGSSAIIGTNCDGNNDSIERNVVHGQETYALFMDNSSNTTIAGNYFSLEADGMTIDNSRQGTVFIQGASSDNNVIGYTEGSSGTCSAAVQRNVIAEPINNFRSAVRLFGNDANAFAGDTGVAPDNNSISGNYIGVNALGTGPAAAEGTQRAGITLLRGATLNIIGTDGDGIDDALEANHIFSSGDAVAILRSGRNRISGNIMGMGSDGVTDISGAIVMDNGIRTVNAYDNIVGWCDTIIDGTLCSDATAIDPQRNIIGFSDTGVRIGFSTERLGVFGNNIGIAADDTTDIGLSGQGVFLHRTSDDNMVGGTGNRSNSIINNRYGVLFDGDFIGSGSRGLFQTGITNATVTGNTISNSDEYGVLGFLTELFEDNAAPESLIVSNNTITDSGIHGIMLIGSSLQITNNTISNSTESGIYVRPGYIEIDLNGEPILVSNIATENFDPDTANDDLESNPSIVGNAISGSGTAGITVFDASVNNYSTLFDDNTWSSNNDVSIRRSWPAAVELIDGRDNSLITAGTYTIEANPVTGSSCSNCSATEPSVQLTSTIWGPSGIDYHDLRTWLEIVGEEFNDSGSEVQNNTYNFTVTGDLQRQVGAEFSINGIDDDAANTQGFPNGISNNGLQRYQIAEVTASTTPQQPTAISPSNGTSEVALTPTYTSSSFVDSSELHATTTINVYSSEASCLASGSGDVYSFTSGGPITSGTIATALSPETTYYWSVYYTNAFGNRSSDASCTKFTTIRTVPNTVGVFTDQAWNEDDSLDNVFDLDNFFNDQEGELLTYTSNLADTDNISLTLDADNQVSFGSAQDWNGTSTISFTACDTDGECVTSNTITLTVNSINDAPTAPASGFSPANGETTADSTPEIMWKAATDVDDGSNITYEFQIGEKSDPINAFSQTITSSAPSVTTDTLDDETTYFYVVRSIDPKGTASEWSAVQSFTVDLTKLPAITLTKEVTVINAETVWLNRLNGIVGSLSWLPIPLPVYGDVAGTSAVRTIEVLMATIAWVSLGLAVITLIRFFLIARSVQHYPRVLWGNASQAFIKIHRFTGEHSEEKVSFNRFKYVLHSNRLLFAVAILSLSLSGMAQATPQPIIDAGLRTLTATLSTSPGEQIDVTVRYRNTGEGDATAVELIDTIPANTTLVSGTTSASLGTITTSDTPATQSGELSYRVQLNNPYTAATVPFVGAELSANEFDEQVVSNAIAIDVISAQLSGRITGLANAASLIIECYVDGNLITTTTTDSTGTYELLGLGNGRYNCSVVAPTGYEATVVSQLVESGQRYENVNMNVSLLATGITTNEEVAPDDNSENEADDTEEEAADVNDDELEDTSDSIKDTILEIVPDVLKPDFAAVEFPTAEEQVVIQELNTELLNNTSIAVSQVVHSVEQSNVVSAFLNNVQDTLFGMDNEVVVSGITQPNARVTISICFTTLETVSDSQGRWVMTIPEDALVDGNSALYGTVEKDGVVSDSVIIGAVDKNDTSGASRTVLVASLSIVALVLLMQLIVWQLVRRSQTVQAKPLAATMRRVIVVDLMAMGLLLGALYSVQVRSYAFDAEGLQQDIVTINSINTQMVSSGVTISEEDVELVEFSGTAPAGAELILTLCRDSAFREITVPASGQWTTQMNITDFPQSEFMVAAQAKAGNVLGEPHDLVNMTVRSSNLEILRVVLFIMHYVLLIISSLVLLKPYQRQNSRK